MGRFGGLAGGAALSNLFDKLTQKGGELVPVGGEPATGDAGFDAGSPFDRFLSRLVPGNPPDDRYKRALLNAAIGSGLGLAAAGAVALLPGGDTVRGNGFYAFGDLTLANFLDTAADFAALLAVFAGILLAVTAVLAVSGRQDKFTAAACVIQPIFGVSAAAGAVLAWGFLALVFLANLVFWIVVIGAIAAAIVGVFAGMGGRR